MSIRRLHTLLLVRADSTVYERKVMATRPRHALRSIRKQLLGIVAVHCIVGGSRVRTWTPEGA